METTNLYLTLAKTAGKQKLVDSLLQIIVPKVLSETRTNIGFSEDANTYEKASYKLAQALAPNTTNNRRHSQLPQKQKLRLFGEYGMNEIVARKIKTKDVK